MADSYTEGLRRSAPQWSLAGDKHLLDVLQGLHQKIIDKCQETNRNVEKMVSALDEASIHLQNVNNKFTALSNSQFIESRVFDDDAVLLTETEKPKVEQVPKSDEMANIKRSLQILENLHESVTIMCDSDSESGTDDDEDITRVVLKPKDLYADRPLPYIIGSRQWKTKWHAGLLPDDSDSVSSGSLKQAGDLEQYSDTEPEPQSESPRHSPEILSSSSELETEQIAHSSCTLKHAQRSQSDVAAELARRLGGTDLKLPESEPVPEAPSPTVRKLYKPHQPAPGAVFPDEPPPLERDQSEESDDDIFAELHKKRPYAHGNKAESSAHDQLFGRHGFKEIPPPVNPPAKQKQPLFEDESEPELFADKHTPTLESQDAGVKKPIGGKSLFGSNANAESIGAAILKRNQRHSTSGEESDEEPAQIKNKLNKPKNRVEEEQIHNNVKEHEVRTQKEKERDIFDDLFAKSERINKENNKSKLVEQKKEQPKLNKKPDLFSDNIFDDIDDIFTTNVKVVTKDEKKVHKSIFDEDDLFADVSKNINDDKMNKTDTKPSKNLFDENNDDIFNDKPTVIKKESKDKKEKTFKETKSIFDDSDDDLFSDVNKTTNNVTSVNVTKNEMVRTKAVNSEKSLFSGDEDLFKNENDTIKSDKIKDGPREKITTENKIKIETSSKQPSKIIKSPDLFDDDEDDGLFLFQTQNKSIPKESTENKPSDNYKLSEEASQESKNPEIMNKSKDTSSIGNEDTPDDLLSKAGKPKDSRFFIHSKDNDIDKSKIIGALHSDEYDNNIFTKSDKTNTTVTKAKPNISENPVIANVTVINTQITVQPTTELLTSQEVTDTDATVIENKVTFTPDVTNKTNTNVDITVNETQIIVKPDIRQKPTISKPSSDFEEHSTKNTSANVLDNMKEVDANKNVTDSIFEDFKTEPPIETKTDVFSDIFNDQPPVFEKPKEPKRSKNVNALFDDDSDDESLFFKKNDVITDEIPEGFVSSDDRLFGLFRDEPPAIDVDFVPKSNKTDRLPKENVSQPVHGETSSQKDNHNISKPDTFEVNIDDKSNDEEIFASRDNKNNISESDDIFDINVNKPISVKNIKLSDEHSNKKDLFSNNVTDELFKKTSVQADVDIFSTPEIDDMHKQAKSDIITAQVPQEKVVPENTDDAKVEPKRIGKLKPMSFNINVDSLLPGASPKKNIKSSDNTDGQAPSKSNDELYTSDSVKDNGSETKLVKSISFDGNTESPVLDNKFSKERAKIQVKRRPSTRRARREAVKKSGIDFGEDSTDNSSSIDDQPKNKDLAQNEKVGVKYKTAEHQEKMDISNKEENVIQDTNAWVEDESEENSHQKQKKDIPESKVKAIDQVSSNFEDTTYEKKSNTILEQNKTEDEKAPEIKTNQPKDVKSKIVYILNDEDIFDAKVSKIPEIPKLSPEPIENVKTDSIFDDPDDIFKSMAKTNNNNDGIKTLGQVYNEPKLNTKKLDFFSDSDDDNLFKTSKITKDVEKKVKTEEQVNVEVKDVPLKSKNRITLFEDSNDDLFKGKPQDVKNKKKVSLFGSDSDEELFGGSKKEKEVPKRENLKKEEIKREFKKGSLFEDDDEDGDLFGTSTKKKIDPKPSKPTASKEVISKPSEPVFNDPLSLLGSDEE